MCCGRKRPATLSADIVAKNSGSKGRKEAKKKSSVLRAETPGNVVSGHRCKRTAKAKEEEEPGGHQLAQQEVVLG